MKKKIDLFAVIILTIGIIIILLELNDIYHSVIKGYYFIIIGDLILLGNIIWELINKK